MASSSDNKLPHFLLGSRSSTFLRVLLGYGGCSLWYIWLSLIIFAITLLFFPSRLWERIRFHPSISRLELDPEPVFIVGHWQTGTSPLQFLLAQDEQFSYLDTLHASLPNTYFTLKRVMKRLLKMILKGKDRGSDSIALSLDLPQGSDLPMACLSPLSMYHSYVFPNNARQVFERGVLLQGLSSAEREQWKRQYLFHIKKIAAAGGCPRVLLRNSADTGRIAALLELFPNAKFIHVVRNPYEVCQAANERWQSMCSIWSLQKFDPEDFHSLTVDMYENLMKQYFEEAADIPASRLATVRYEDLQKQPIETLQTTYEQLSISGFDTVRPKIEQYLQTQQGSLAGENLSHLTNAQREKIKAQLQFVFDKTGYRA
ncbi:sulfotransferase [Planctomycetaceae bacterium]|jgi:omega-hydroxy-beta-dihydromenaquinone-9 sulfotransferase|nr:sulfotransferase [Planctomycetaceae bacterium]MDG2390369.1 sulfotransferase [Planctomycetaceae bacterium]